MKRRIALLLDREYECCYILFKSKNTLETVVLASVDLK